MCDAGIDVVFSGHSHMHSITDAQCGSRTIYSIVTSSLVNLPLAYRSAAVDHNGRMTLTSGNLKDCEIQGGGNLQKKGEKYWQDLSDYYMKEASDKAWDAAGPLLSTALGFKDKAAEEALQGILDFFDKKHVLNILDLVLKILFGISIDEVHTQFSEFFHSAYFNYLGDGPVMPDDAIVIQLTK